MNFIEQLTAVALLVDFFLGVTFGVIGGAAHGSLREDRERTLLRAARDPVSAGARAVHGLYTGDDGYLATLLSGSGQALMDGRRDERRSDGPAHGQDSER